MQIQKCIQTHTYKLIETQTHRIYPTKGSLIPYIQCLKDMDSNIQMSDDLLHYIKMYRQMGQQRLAKINADKNSNNNADT